MDDKKVKTAGARVDYGTYNLLKSIAKSKKWSVSVLIDEMIKEWLISEGYREDTGKDTSKAAEVMKRFAGHEEKPTQIKKGA